MLEFVLGVLAGGVTGFLVSAVLKLDSSEKDKVRPAAPRSETGESDATSE